MACGGCGGRKVEYEVRKPDGSRQIVATTAEALTVIRAAGGGTFKAKAKR